MNLHDILPSLLSNFTKSDTDSIRQAEFEFNRFRENCPITLLDQLIYIAEIGSESNIEYSALIQIGKFFFEDTQKITDPCLKEKVILSIEGIFLKKLQNFIKLSSSQIDKITSLELNFILKTLEKCILERQFSEFPFMKIFQFFASIILSPQTNNYSFFGESLQFFSSYARIYPKHPFLQEVFNRIQPFSDNPFISLSSFNFICSYDSLEHDFQGIELIPQILHSLPDDFFGKALSSFWSLANFYHSILIPIFEPVLSIFFDKIGNRDHNEFIRRHTLFVVSKLVTISKECLSIITRTENIHPILNSLASSFQQPDEAYYEGQKILKYYEDEDELFNLINYSNELNAYVSSAVLPYYICENTLPLALQYAQSNDETISLNGLKYIKRFFKKETLINTTLFLSIGNFLQTNLNRPSFIPIFLSWCKFSSVSTAESVLQLILSNFPDFPTYQIILCITELLSKFSNELETIPNNIVQIAFHVCKFIPQMFQSSDEMDIKEQGLLALSQLCPLMPKEHLSQFFETFIKPYIFEPTIFTSQYMAAIIQEMDKEFLPFLNEYLQILLPFLNRPLTLFNGEISSMTNLDNITEENKTLLRENADGSLTYTNDYDAFIRSSGLSLLTSIFTLLPEVLLEDNEFNNQIIQIINRYLDFPNSILAIDAFDLMKEFIDTHNKINSESSSSIINHCIELCLSLIQNPEILSLESLTKLIDILSIITNPIVQILPLIPKILNIFHFNESNSDENYDSEESCDKFGIIYSLSAIIETISDSEMKYQVIQFFDEFKKSELWLLFYNSTSDPYIAINEPYIIGFTILLISIVLNSNDENDPNLIKQFLTFVKNYITLTYDEENQNQFRLLKITLLSLEDILTQKFYIDIATEVLNLLNQVIHDRDLDTDIQIPILLNTFLAISSHYLTAENIHQILDYNISNLHYLITQSEREINDTEAEYLIKSSVDLLIQLLKLYSTNPSLIGHINSLLETIQVLKESVDYDFSNLLQLYQQIVDTISSVKDSENLISVFKKTLNN